MGIGKIWQTTLAFRDFREKTHELSRVYWTQQLATDHLLEELKTKDPDKTVTSFISSSFEKKMFPDTVGDSITWLPVFMERNRLHLLVVYTAFLETYLKEISFFYAASLGHIENRGSIKESLKLSAVGQAIVAPILRSSTVPDMIKYASELYSIDFGPNSTEWIHIYKIRCAAAHNGGIATPRFLREISGFPLATRPKEYENIGLNWNELRNAMRLADEIAAMIDQKISSYKIRLLEVEQVLREVKSNKKLPKKEGLWQYLNDEYSINRINRSDKNTILGRFYEPK